MLPEKSRIREIKKYFDEGTYKGSFIEIKEDINIIYLDNKLCRGRMPLEVLEVYDNNILDACKEYPNKENTTVLLLDDDAFSASTNIASSLEDYHAKNIIEFKRLNYHPVNAIELELYKHLDVSLPYDRKINYLRGYIDHLLTQGYNVGKTQLTNYDLDNVIYCLESASIGYRNSTLDNMDHEVYNSEFIGEIYEKKDIKDIILSNRNKEDKFTIRLIDDILFVMYPRSGAFTINQVYDFEEELHKHEDLFKDGLVTFIIKEMIPVPKIGFSVNDTIESLVSDAKCLLYSDGMINMKSKVINCHTEWPHKGKREDKISYIKSLFAELIDEGVEVIKNTSGSMTSVRTIHDQVNKKGISEMEALVHFQNYYSQPDGITETYT